MEPFRVRLNCIDHYQATPTEFDPPLPYRDGAPQREDRPKVPVIRIFGSTETGQKCCVHVHGAFPYLYIEYTGPLDPPQVASASRSLHLSIDHALALSYRRNAYDRKTAFVAHVSLVKGVPFYGYHVGYRFFFKIYLLNPLYMTRVADLLLQGAVLKRPLQPYESHLQYVPQWMCDYSLYGCAYMDCKKYQFRSPVPEYLELSTLSHRWHDRSISPANISQESLLPKQSHCPLELDVCVQDISNRVEIKERPLHQDFTELLKPVMPNGRLVPSMAGLWQDETRRRKNRLGITDPGSSPFGPEELVSMSADPRNYSKGGWIHEEEYHDMVLKLAADERRQGGNRDISVDNFLTKRALEEQVQTALQSVEELYPGKLQLAQVISTVGINSHAGHESVIQVNENAVLSSDPDEVPPHGDEFDSDDPFPVTDAPVPIESTLDEIQNDGLFDLTLQSYRQTNSSPLKPTPPSGVDQGAESALFEMSDPASRGGSSSEQLVTASNRDARFEARRTYGLPECLERDAAEGSEVGRAKRVRIEDTLRRSSSCLDSEIDGMRPQTKPVNVGYRPRSVRFGKDPSSSGSSSQRVPQGGGRDQRLIFPVVKDPNDPMTILRFSQASKNSAKSNSQSSQRTRSSPAKDLAVTSVRANDPPSQSRSSLTSDTTSSVALDSHASKIARSLRTAFSMHSGRPLCCFQPACPTKNDVSSTLTQEGRPNVIYQKAYYSDESDVPERQREYAGREFRLQSNSIHYLPPFDSKAQSPAMFGDQPPVSIDQDAQLKADQHLRELCSLKVWEYGPVPPSRSEVISWFESTQITDSERRSPAKKDVHPHMKPNVLSQIEGPTQRNEHGFKYSQKGKSTSVEFQTQYMSTMSLEVHVNTRGVLAPNPEEDEITAIFWCIQSEDDDFESNGALPNSRVGMLFHGDETRPERKISRALKIDLEHEPTELDLLTRLVDIVRQYDPDVITGYEVHNSSWGYLIERARKKYDYDLCDELSRVKSQAHGRFGKDNDRWGFNHTSSIRVTGRHMINIWRAMRSELNLLQYTMENVVFHLLHRRIPHYSSSDLTTWHQSGKPRNMLKLVDYYVSRVQMDLEILDSNELIPRTSEQARLLGIDFFSVFSRGSQFKVESLMFRIAKPENFILVSPSRKQVGGQNALECLPLVMEPQSDFYTSPLLVLDFQSLYPSVMIAYNYCYSTFLGRASHWRGRDKMGFLDYQRQPWVLELLRDKINIAPNGIIYAKTEVRKSLLAKMLTEILETRVMVKTGMKMDKEDKILQRLLNNRQLALKLIANVTYGYTSASFSGRMPCSEIADSIVQTGRETLEKAIAYIHSVERWGAEVVYGDTDSLFVYLRGRTRDEAFDIGEEIAKAITDMNPRPVKLKFEKVYHPCVLLAKKRYVGFKYEHRAQEEPEFDAKGIETVRRDGTPAEQKIEEKALKLLFRTADLSQVKSYFQSQCSKIMQGKVSIQDFCFAKEVRLGTYSDKGLLPPGALISTKKMLEDPRMEPQYGERVPYVVVTGAPGSRLVDRCVAPETLLHDAQLELDSEYYITKNIIPPLERIFNLVGANVRQWYEEMPKVQRIRRVEGVGIFAGGKDPRKTLESYMKSSACIICRTKLEDTDVPLCAECMQRPHVSLLSLHSRLQQAEKRVLNLHNVCRSCMGVPFGDGVECDSKDCSVFYSRTRDSAHWKHTKAVLEPVVKLLEDHSRNDLDW